MARVQYMRKTVEIFFFFKIEFYSLKQLNFECKTMGGLKIWKVGHNLVGIELTDLSKLEEHVPPHPPGSDSPASISGRQGKHGNCTQ